METTSDQIYSYQLYQERQMNQLFEIRKTKEMGRGMFSLKQIQVGTRLLLLDSYDYITYGMIAEHPFFCRIFELEQSQVTAKTIFAFYLAFVQNHKEEQMIYSNNVTQYIQNLPKNFNNLICWEQGQLQKLNNKQVIEKIRNKKNKLKQMYQRLKGILSSHCNQNDQFIPNYLQSSFVCQEQRDVQYKSQEHSSSDQTLAEDINISEYQKLCGQIKFEDVIFFYAAIESHNVYFTNQYDKNSKLGALIPILQLFNHFPQGQAQKDGCILKTTKPIKENQQIFVTYGQLSPEYLLQNYGFLIDEHFYQIRNKYQSQEPQEKQFGQEEGSQQEQTQLCLQTGERTQLERSKLAQRYNKLYQKQQQRANFLHYT